tara:strand:+ start:787 stop:1773 length:987 start_codon:yes stop_codon:yes gene_type:complete
MANYNPPTEDITEFNTSLFNQPEETLSQAEADLLYLSKKKSDISTAPLTTFNGDVIVGGMLDLISGANTSEIYQNGLTLEVKGKTPSGVINFTTQNSLGADNICLQINNSGVQTGVIVASNTNLFTKLIKSTSPTSVNHVLFDNMSGSGVLTIGATATLNTIRGITTFTQDAIFANRLNFSATSYTFPFASNQSLGYYLKETGTAFTTLTTATPKTILTTSSIPVGVWRVDFSVQLTQTATGSHSITSAQSYISSGAADGNVGTAVPFTGSVVRSHVTETYSQNDIQVLTSSFTYQQSTAGALRLNIVRSFSTGTYSFTGEVAITRLA